MKQFDDIKASIDAMKHAAQVMSQEHSYLKSRFLLLVVAVQHLKRAEESVSIKGYTQSQAEAHDNLWEVLEAVLARPLGVDLPPHPGEVPTERRALKVNHNIDGMVQTLRDNPPIFFEITPGVIEPDIIRQKFTGKATHIVGGTNKGCQHVWDLEAASCSLCGQGMPGPTDSYSIADECAANGSMGHHFELTPQPDWEPIMQCKWCGISEEEHNGDK